jgi:hypothetical protein
VRDVESGVRSDCDSKLEGDQESEVPKDEYEDFSI